MGYSHFMYSSYPIPTAASRTAPLLRATNSCGDGVRAVHEMTVPYDPTADQKIVGSGNEDGECLMLFLIQDCSFDSLGISSVAVYLVDTGNAQMF